MGLDLYSGHPGAQCLNRREQSQVRDGLLGYRTPLEARADSAAGTYKRSLLPPFLSSSLRPSLPPSLCLCVPPGSLGEDFPRYRRIILLSYDYKHLPIWAVGKQSHVCLEVGNSESKINRIEAYCRMILDVSG